MTTDEEIVLHALALLMAEVRWERAGDDEGARKFVTVSRRVKLFSDVPGANQPACFQAEHNTDEDQKTNLPYKGVLMANWIIYHQFAKTSPQALGAVENNLILRGVREALKPKPTDPGFHDRRNTLGGLVHHCFISGRIFKDPGDIDDQAMLVVPIKVLVP